MRNMKRHAPEVGRGRVFGTSPFQWSLVFQMLALCAWALWAPNAGALGLLIPNQDASAIARGNAFVATADNPSAIYYNPAGITQLEGEHIQAGSLLYLGIYGDYESPSGTTVHNNAEVLAAPTLQYTFSPEGLPLSFGLGVYEPFGFSVDWPNSTPFRQEAMQGHLDYLTINPVVAWKVVPSLSIAAGPTFNYSTVDFIQGLLPVPYPSIPGAQAEFKGDNWSCGFNAGVLWQPLPNGPSALPTAAAAARTIKAISSSNRHWGTIPLRPHLRLTFPRWQSAASRSGQLQNGTSNSTSIGPTGVR